MCPLADFKTLPEDLLAVPLPNGDIALRYPDGQEASFNVIGVIVGCTLDMPPTHSKSVGAVFGIEWLTFPKVNFPLLSAMGEDNSHR